MRLLFILTDLTSFLNEKKGFVLKNFWKQFRLFVKTIFSLSRFKLNQDSEERRKEKGEG
jgi:hypothetical protein